MSDDVSRYRENCSLFTTLPVASFENALEHKQPVCSLAGQGVDDNAMVCESLRNRRELRSCAIAL